jgi:tellurite resistance protein TerC
MPPTAVIRSLLVFDDKHPLYNSYRIAKRIAIGIVGGTVLALGIVMMITPGPGIPAILAGLGILALEFAWAKIWLKKVKTKAEAMARSFSNRNGSSHNGSVTTPPGSTPTDSTPPGRLPPQ